jgi:hypothetical protein
MAEIAVAIFAKKKNKTHTMYIKALSIMLTLISIGSE